MTKFISEQNLSTGWLAALEYLLRCKGGMDTNVIVAIRNIPEEVIAVRSALDAFIDRQKDKKNAMPVETVANTIFPQSLYLPKSGERARRHLYEQYEQAYTVIKRYPPNRRGTYFHRIIAWPGIKRNNEQLEQAKINQLERVIERLKQGLAQKRVYSSVYEVALSDVEAEQTVNIPEFSCTEEIRIQSPRLDTVFAGFPCLSHISLTWNREKLHLSAMYRNQHFIHKAYGNYVGLSRLLCFICQEVGCEPGELVCIATHADAELNMGKQVIESLIRQCKVATGALSELWA